MSRSWRHSLGLSPDQSADLGVGEENRAKASVHRLTFQVES
jgi:hypothetical protein